MKVPKGLLFFLLVISLVTVKVAPNELQRALFFVDSAATAGLTATNVFGGVAQKRYLLETTGCGVAFIDYDRDGWVDLFVVNGRRFDDSLQPPPTSHLYRNTGQEKLTDVTEAAGLTYSGWGQGACVADYDNDGYDDLFVTYYGKNKLYHNNHGSSFSDLAERAGVAGGGGRWNTGCAFLDYDRDGWVDLFVANYVDLGLDLSNLPSPGSGQFCQYKGIPLACGPRGLKKAVNHLYRNNRDGTFSDESDAAGIRQTEGHYSLGVVPFDFNQDGWPDIYVACDSAPSILYQNNKNGTFKDVGFPSGTSFNEDGEAQAGMGVAVADCNHDGYFDLLKTNFADDSPNLYLNSGDGTFSDRVFRSGLGRRRSFLGWGVLFLDYDNDGWSDILMVNGHLSPEVDVPGIESKYRQRKLLYRNQQDGTFQDVSTVSGPGLTALHSSRGAAVADLGNDGRLAVAVNEMNEAPTLLTLQGQESGHWIGIRLSGTKSNRSALGARVEVQAGNLKQIDEVRSGGSYLSQSDLRLHFGLGKNRKIDRIIVHWPSGVADELQDVIPDQPIVIEEGTSAWKAAESKKRAVD